jgi:hypothetical protein
LLTPEQLRLRAEIGAHEKWAREPDRPAATAKARAAFLAKLAAEVDPAASCHPRNAPAGPSIFARPT